MGFRQLEKVCSAIAIALAASIAGCGGVPAKPVKPLNLLPGGTEPTRQNSAYIRAYNEEPFPGQILMTKWRTNILAINGQGTNISATVPPGKVKVKYDCEWRPRQGQPAVEGENEIEFVAEAGKIYYPEVKPSSYSSGQVTRGDVISLTGVKTFGRCTVSIFEREWK